MTPTELNDVTGKIIELSIKVHKSLGPGMLEGAYEICLTHELVKNGFKVERQKKLPITYEGIRLDAGYRIDLIVNDSVIVEVKAVERLNPVHEAQLLSYLRMTGVRLGLLINFNMKMLRDGVKRVVNKL